MTDAEALVEIRRLAGLDRIYITRHCQRDSMPDRNASYDDVRQALVTATSATYQPDRENYRVTGGCDLDGDSMICIVAIEADLVVITVY